MGRLQMKRKSLFFRMFLSFMVIIAIVSSFNFALFSFFQNNIQQEIIHTNLATLDQAADRFQTQFIRIKTALSQTSNDSSVTRFNRQLLRADDRQTDYLLAGNVARSLAQTAGNPMYYVDNLIVLFRSGPLAVDKEGSSGKDGIEAVFPPGAPYPLAYWQNEFDKPGNYRVHPAALYMAESFGGESRQLVPVSYKTPGSNYVLVAMMNTDAFTHSVVGSAPLLILGKDGRVLYRSEAASDIANIPDFLNEETHKLFQNRYFFVKTDPDNELRYMTVVPYSVIASQISKLRVTQTVVLLVSIAAALAMSYWFSRRLHSPLKQIVTSIYHEKSQHPKLDTAIPEFDLINEHIRKLMEERDSVHYELQNSKSLLTNYNYIARLKSLHSGIAEWQHFVQSEGPFFLVLYQLKSRKPGTSTAATDEMRTHISEYVSLVMPEHAPHSYTFQIENDRIVTVVFRQSDRDRFEQALIRLKQTLDRDRHTCLVTIAVSSQFPVSSELNRAYEQVSAMLEQARPLDESQLIMKPESLPPQFIFTSEQEHELYAHLQAGNEKMCLQAMERMLEQMEKKQATVRQYVRFAESFSARAEKVMDMHKLGAAETEECRKLIGELWTCCTTDEFNRYFARIIRETSALVQSKKSAKDPIVDFVMAMLEEQSPEHVSLELIADKLNLSSTYLSVYIKEKTGVNFSDHMNRIRIGKAKELLVNSELSVQDIGGQIGYSNVTSFIRMFKKLTGTTPGEFRRWQV